MRIALIQMLVKQSRKKENLSRAVSLIDTAAISGADIVVLPECPFVGWLSEKMIKLSEEVPGPISSILSQKARKHSIFIASGLTEKENGRIFNSALLFDDNGQLVLKYQKINVFAKYYLDLDIYNVGTNLSAADIKYGRIAITICSDSWVPYITQSLSRMGVKLILSPNDWAAPPDEIEKSISSIKNHYKERTVKNDVYLIGANSVGKITEGIWKGRVIYGNSLIYAPGGKCIAEGKRNIEEIIYCDLPI